MANTFITPTSVAKLALITLLNNWVFAGLVHRDYAKEFRKVGNTVRIRKPATLTAIEFDGDLTGEYQNIVESYVDVLLDTVLVVPVEVSALDMTLDIVSFNTQVVEPAMQALAQGIDEKLAKLYKDIPYFEDCESTTAISDLLNARKVQNDLKVPFPTTRYAVMSPLTTASLLALDAFRDLDKTGKTKALREASLGRLFGYEFFENQNIQTHPTHASITADNEGTAAISNAGVTSMVVSALGGDGTIYKGTIFTIAGDTTQYVVKADAAISVNAATISFYPALVKATPAGTEVVTFHKTLTTSKENLLFHKNAFALVTAPMAEPIGGAKGVTMNYKGLTINVVYDYVSQQMKNIMTFSILCGFKTLTPELAVRLYDAS